MSHLEPLDIDEALDSDLDDELEELLGETAQGALDDELDLEPLDELDELELDQELDIDEDLELLEELPIIGRAPMSYGKVKHLVYQAGAAIDAAKKGAQPSRAGVERAVAGDLDAQIACAAIEYAADHPCGCRKKTPHLLPESETESEAEAGWTVLARSN